MNLEPGTDPRALILTIDDDPDLAAVVALHLRRWGHAASSVESAAELWRFLGATIPDVMLMDVQLGDADGSQLIAQVRRRLPHVPVIMITRSTSVEAAVRCMKHGASDYITKPVDFERLEQAIGAALELGRLGRRVAALEPAPPRESFHGLIGKSAPMLRLYQLIENMAPADVSALILGETGTGKELVARAIHAMSRRTAGPFVAVNAAAIPRELIESALFGHEKGAFTGAVREHVGYCEQADSGTLFLDEIGEMEVEVQAKLLRFLQDHEVQRVGARRGRRVDVRVLAATNVDPLRQIAERKLREDLYYRLRVVSLRVPPLRERGEDVALLAAHFLARASERHGRSFDRIAPAALHRLTSHRWPGNVRELENVIEEAVVLHRGEELAEALLPPELMPTPMRRAEPVEWGEAEREERAQVEGALEHAGGVPETAAAKLGMSRATIYRKIKKYGLARGRG